MIATLARWRSRVQIPPGPRDREPLKRGLRARWARDWERLRNLDVKGRILRLGLELRDRVSPRTLYYYLRFLCRLELLCEEHGITIDDVDEASRLVKWLPGWLVRSGSPGYHHYCRLYRLPEPRFEVRWDKRAVLPRLPPIETFQAALAVPRSLKWRAYLRLLYETGARPQEALHLRVRDLNLREGYVILGTAKGSGWLRSRRLPISPRLQAMLRELIKNRGPDDPVFPRRHAPGLPARYNEAERLMRVHIRPALEAAGLETEGLTLYAFRHLYASRLYAETGDLLLVARSLGHRDVKTTTRYIHLQPGSPRRYEVRHLPLEAADEIAELLSQGWEVALKTESRVWLRRPRWP